MNNNTSPFLQNVIYHPDGDNYCQNNTSYCEQVYKVWKLFQSVYNKRGTTLTWYEPSQSSSGVMYVRAYDDFHLIVTSDHMLDQRLLLCLDTGTFRIMNTVSGVGSLTPFLGQIIIREWVTLYEQEMKQYIDTYKDMIEQYVLKKNYTEQRSTLKKSCRAITTTKTTVFDWWQICLPGPSTSNKMIRLIDQEILFLRSNITSQDTFVDIKQLIFVHPDLYVLVLETGYYYSNSPSEQHISLLSIAYDILVSALEYEWMDYIPKTAWVIREETEYLFSDNDDNNNNRPPLFSCAWCQTTSTNKTSRLQIPIDVFYQYNHELCETCTIVMENVIDSHNYNAR